MSQKRRSSFESNLWDWLETDGPNWASRDEDDRQAIYQQAIDCAAERGQKTERYIARMAQSLDLAGDWVAFVKTDDLIAKRVHPNINPQSFAYQLPRRARRFGLQAAEQANA